MRKIIFILITIFTLIACEQNQQLTPNRSSLQKVSTNLIPMIKQSRAGICHGPDSRSFDRTKNYTSYESVQNCIYAGGKNYKDLASSNIDKAEKDNNNQRIGFISLYNRNDWPHWIDFDKDCQNTRHELLIDTSNKPVQFKSDKNCYVLTGEWFDLYSGETYTNAKDLDLDHIVPLKFAHRHGGDKWNRKLKQTFANDVENLLLVDASLNRQKGTKGLSEWLPPNNLYRCDYIKHFNRVMKKYELSFFSSEQLIVNRLLDKCNIKPN